MNFDKFLKLSEPNLILKLFERLDYINNEIRFIKIENSPDYNISPYEREELANYYFKNEWYFETEYDFIIEATYHESAIFHLDNITDIANQYSIEYESYNDKFSDIVAIAYQIDKNSFSFNSFDPRLDNYILNDLKISSIDNHTKQLIYEGSFWGDSASIDPLDYELIAKINVIGARKGFNNLDFFSQLLIEAFLLIKEKKYNLAFFMTYSAIENFVNTIMNSHDDETRFKDKLKELFKTHLPEFASNQIYTSLIGDFDNYTNIRNTIVHGKHSIEIDKTIAESFLKFTLILISLHTWKSKSFDELIAILK